jgi:tellurium resistance protein TerD
MNLGSLINSSSPKNDVAPLNLNKGDILDLTKEAPKLKKVIVGCGWDANDPGSNSFDLDLSAFLLNSRGRVVNPQEHVVFFNGLNRQGIYLEGDNLTGDGEDGEDDERIHVSLNEIDPDIQSIIFNVNIFKCDEKRQTFGLVKNSYIRLLDEEDNEREIARFKLKENASTATALTFAKLVREANGWSFQAIGEGLVVRDLNELLVRYM